MIRAHDRLVQSIERSEFATVLDVLVNGDEGEVNEVRALQLLADHGGGNVVEPPARAACTGSRATRACAPRSSGCAAAGSSTIATDGWYIVDPLFNEWLRRASPLADRPALERPGDDCNHVPPRRYMIVLLRGTSRLELGRERDDLAAQDAEVLEA